MNSILELLSTAPVTIALGWTLVHFIWQAAVIGLAAWAIRQSMRSRTAHSRYLVLTSGLALMMLAPIITFVVLLSTGESNVAITRPLIVQPVDTTSPQPVVIDSDTAEITFNLSPGISPSTSSLVKTKPAPAPEKQSQLTAWGESIMSQSDLFLPWFVRTWLAGVLLLAVRLTFGFSRVKRWRHGAQPVADKMLNLKFEKLRHAMLIRSAVQIMQSTHVLVPTVIGWLKPVVLLPVSLIAELTTEELESILAHELAHIRRHDYLVNLVQIVAETGLFYHPAVWWISNQIRIERENCCDDIAVSVCGSRFVFATALTRIESLRHSPNHSPNHSPDRSTDRLVVAADGGSLIARIRRLTITEPRLASRWPAGLVTLIALTISAGSFAISSATTPPDMPNAPGNQTIPPQTLAVAPQPISDPASHSDPEFTTDGYPTRMGEIAKIDSKTGLEKRVYPNIKLVSNETTPAKTAQLEMMYSNVMRYTFITERIAKQLGALHLGEIDFGATAPVRPGAFQTGIESIVTPTPTKRPNKRATAESTTVAQLTKPAGTTKIVPYEGDTFWIPGRLGSYGMNQVNQHKFEVVRIDSVDLGIGLPFGPINVLVLKDANSDFGVIGKDASRRVSGNKREKLWWSAGGVFQLVPVAKRRTASSPSAAQSDSPTNPTASTPADAAQPATAPTSQPRQAPIDDRPIIRNPGQIIAMANNAKFTHVDLNKIKPEINRLKTRHYALGTRASTGWVTVDGVRQPVDGGVERDGVIVYVSLMCDVIAVDAKTNDLIWQIPWGKTKPMWHAVSIVELEIDGKKKTGVEVFASDNFKREYIFHYLDLKTGHPIASQNPARLIAKPKPGSPQLQIDIAPEANKNQSTDDIMAQTDRKPWSVNGHVTGSDGKPIEGVLVKAHCGYGTLFQTGSATTDADGKYSFNFGPGIISSNPELVQAATISVKHGGHFEKNLHRHGDLIAAFAIPKREIGWGKKTIDDLFLPGKPKTIDFIMLPSAKFNGLVATESGKRPEGLKVSLVGNDMPPSSSVVAHTRTDEHGRFELTDIPTGFGYQIVVEPAASKSPWLAWASPPMTFKSQDGGHTRIEYSMNDQDSKFTFASLMILLKGDGVNSKTAIKKAAAKKLELTWDGLSVGNDVHARSASLEIGDEKTQPSPKK